MLSASVEIESCDKDYSNRLEKDINNRSLRSFKPFNMLYTRA